MSTRKYACLLPLLLAGCAARVPPAALADAAPAVAVVDPVQPLPVAEMPVVVEPAPNLCELLLSSLDETLPLLAALDRSLIDQSAALQNAVAKLDQPPPRPPSAECAAAAPAFGNKEIIGAIEWLYLSAPGRHYRARIDSSAELSMIGATNLVAFERDGDDWVRFTFEHENSGDPIELELPVKRTAVRKLPSGQSQRRTIVELDVQLGNQLQTVEFALDNRNVLSYPLLLGRAFLMDLYVVDVSRSYTHGRYDAGD